MQIVQWQDDKGRNHKAMIRDGDPVHYALNGYGIPLDPPDIDSLDWEAIKTALHNAMLEQGLTSWEDVKRSGGGLNVVLGVLKRHLMTLFTKGG